MASDKFKKNDEYPPPLFESFSIKTVLSSAKDQLSEVSDSPALDAELLLAHCLARNRTYLHTWPERCLTERQMCLFQELVKKRATDYPIAYLLEKQSFWTLDLIVTPDVLIPRPETELLVEVALEKLQLIKNPKILDLGTGSGAIALAIASERPDARVIACDYSFAALEVARMNTIENKLEDQVALIKSNWFSNIDESDFDLIVSNPPYISAEDPHLVQTIRYEPRSALVAHDAGMKDIETIVTQSLPRLKNNCWLLIEHGYDQASATKALLTESLYSLIETRADYNNNQRITIAKRSN